MTDDKIFYTKTMARIHADQRHFTKAAEIYQHLLKQDPERQDIIEALAGLESLKFQKRIEDLVPLIEKWTRLVLECSRKR